MAYVGICDVLRESDLNSLLNAMNFLTEAGYTLSNAEIWHEVKQEEGKISKNFIIHCSFKA